MKKSIKLLSFLVLTYFLLLGSVSAASLSLSKSSSNINSGQQVTITVSPQGFNPGDGAEFTVKYDSGKFDFVSSSGDCSGLHCQIFSDGKAQLKFKAKSNGTATFSVSGQYSDENGATNVSASTSVTVGGSSSNSNESTKTLNANNNLSGLSIEGYSLSPEFNKDTLEYSVSLPGTTESINVNATAEEKSSKVAGIGEIKVSEGVNTIEVVVTAENGSKKTYVIKANVEEKNPIKVSIENGEYTLVSNKDNLTKPDNYEEKTIKIDDKEVPAFYSDITKFTLVGLKDNKGNIDLYIYNEKDKSYTLYKEIKSNSINFYPMTTKKVPKGYSKYTIDINGIKVEGFKINKDSKYAIVYGMDVETGKKNYYMYDIDNNTLQIYNEEHVNLLLKNNKLYTYIILGSWGMLLLFIIIVIVLCVKNSKRKKKMRNLLDKIGGEGLEGSVDEIVNDEQIVEEVIDSQEDEDEMYDLLEEDKKRSKKKSRK